MHHLHVNPGTLYIGCMTGTSVDAYADFTAAMFDENGTPTLQQHRAIHLPAALQNTLKTLSTSAQVISLAEKRQIERQFTLFLVHAYQQVISYWQLNNLPRHRIILSPHGQTICHQPEQALTEQLLDANLLAKKTGYRVAHQHRSACIKVSNAAPLAPVLFRQLFKRREKNIIVINGGGIANITVLPANHHEDIVGYDTGPANGPIDSLVRYFAQTRPTELPCDMQQAQYDHNGLLAASGKLILPLQQRLLADEYFTRPIKQKSADRSHFDLNWIGTDFLKQHTAADLCYTTAMVIATTITDAIQQHYKEENSLIYFYGGMSHNRFIMQTIAQQLKEQQQDSIGSLSSLGFHLDYMESLLMAYLGHCVHQQRTIDLRYCSSHASAYCIPGILTGLQLPQHASNSQSKPRS